MEEEKENIYNLSNALIEEHKRQELKIDIFEKLEPAPECCIYRVPKDLRQLKEDAYTPQLISIGPFHHGKQELASMEKQKVRYKEIFGKRIRTEKWEDFITFIKDHEQHIRNCYAETFNIQRFEFISMILYDAVFIIELLLQHHKGSKDFLLYKRGIRNSIRLDLQLLENQLPYFVLEQLYKLAELSGEVYPDFLSLSCQFFNDGMFNDEYRKPDQVEVKHFLDLRRCALVMSYPEEMSKGYPIDLPCAVKLHQSGVRFKCIKEEWLLDIRFEKIKRRIPCLKVYEMQIPNIKIYDETDCLFRNLMALEQCHYPFETHICNFIQLMNFLVNSKKDVELLVEAGIISNCVDNDAVAKMFSQLCLQVHLSDSCYYYIVEELKAHYHDPWNRAKATLKSVYFNNVWRGTGTIAATMLLLLTFIQTVFSILQVVPQK